MHVSVLLALDAVDPPQDEPRKPALILSLFERLPPAVPIDVTMFVVPPPQVALAPTPTTSLLPDSAAAAETAAETETAAVGPDPLVLSDGRSPESKDASRPPGALSMRRAAAPDLDPHRQQLRIVDDPDAAPPWTPPRPSDELDPSGGGTYRRRRPGYVGKVAPDGDVTFEDGKSFSAEWRLPNPAKVVKRAAKGLQNWYRDPGAQVRSQEVDKSTCHRGGGDGTNNCLVVSDYGGRTDNLGGLTESTKIDEDDGVLIPILGGRVELTDYVMRKVGMDPYQSDKLRWMDATRDERVQISRVHRARQLAGANQSMKRHLDRLWARTDLDLAAKRAALFELWDDGAEDGDAAVVEAATRTRAQVIGFVRARLAAAATGAYTESELDALNRRRTSRARFAPYD